MITKTTVKKTIDHVSTCPRIKMLECRNCGCTFTPEDEWNTCLECMHCHCDCGLCWDAGDSDHCPYCYPPDREERDYGMELRTIPGTSLTYWA